MKHRSPLAFIAILIVWSFVSASLQAEEGFKPLSDGKTFEGWEGDTDKIWKIEDGAFVAGSLDSALPRNDFLATKKEFGDFELKLEYKLDGTEGFVNGGVQFRTKRIPNDHEVSGYQADLGAGFDGALYDESRRNKILAQPTPEVLKKANKPGEWNSYHIIAKGNKIELILNGVKTVEYTEMDEGIAKAGIIAVQVHGGGKTIVRYRNLQIKELK